MPTRREVHRALLQGEVGPLNTWKSEGKSLSHFQKNIIEYDYSIRNHLYVLGGRLKIKVKHRGWSTLGEMTPQAWTVMEILTGIEHLTMENTQESMRSIMEGAAFISTGLSRREHTILWPKLMYAVHCTDDISGKVWVAIFVAVAKAIMNYNDSLDYSVSKLQEFTQDYITRKMKMELLREFHFAPSVHFDTFIKWLYVPKSAPPQIITDLITYQDDVWGHIRSAFELPGPLVPPNASSSSHQQSPLEQSVPLDSTSYPSFQSQEANQNP